LLRAAYLKLLVFFPVTLICTKNSCDINLMEVWLTLRINVSSLF